ncbi:hypothetical protein TELCIR_16558 [Teladorsagia circumcincta]|uniref:RNA-directed DNA polymerase n=1 Tax=Teladorsagia circumcincta TaxID=45464 RepID=A0A2G9TVA2_TELCI|nr:hypothetical protein TELCIR_16558 [Teladorsagia circumcincta]
MGSPKLEKTNVTVKNASGDRMKIRGKLKCTVEMKGSKSVGYAYVTPYNSLMGLEWMQNNKEMLHHMGMMVAEVNTKRSSYVEEELKKTYPEVFSEVQSSAFWNQDSAWDFSTNNEQGGSRPEGSCDISRRYPGCGATEEEHNRNVLSLFERIAEYGFKIRMDKCSFAKSEIRYLGFIVDKNGRRQNPQKIEAIKNMAEPRDVKQLCAIPGMVTSYSTFMPSMKSLRRPLDAMLRKDVKWKWTSVQQDAFQKLKSALSTDLNLAHYDPREKIVVAADACEYGIGCVSRTNTLMVRRNR